MSGLISLPVLDCQGNQVDTVQIDPAEFGGKINRQLLHDVVVMYQANLRQGTAKVKRRGEVAGSGRKMYIQKGTGRARAGSRRSPIRRGGGVAHAKRPRSFKYRLPKKMVRAATRMALLSKFVDNETTVVESLEIEEPKTRRVAEILRALNLDGQSCLITPARYDPVLWKSARNIARVKVLPAADLNALELLKQKRLLITREALEWLRKTPEQRTQKQQDTQTEEADE